MVSTPKVNSHAVTTFVVVVCVEIPAHIEVVARAQLACVVVGAGLPAGYFFETIIWTVVASVAAAGSI